MPLRPGDQIDRPCSTGGRMVAAGRYTGSNSTPYAHREKQRVWALGCQDSNLEPSDPESHSPGFPLINESL